jgi:hypothetical protein
VRPLRAIGAEEVIIAAKAALSFHALSGSGQFDAYGAKEIEAADERCRRAEAGAIPQEPSCEKHAR